MKLLLRALNDSFPGVRNEAFKSALNLKINGGGEDTLRFILRSIHADVRIEVLTELMAQVKQPWAWRLLLTFLNDPDEVLRSETFEYAKKQASDLEPLEAALASRFIDMRTGRGRCLGQKALGARASDLGPRVG